MKGRVGCIYQWFEEQLTDDAVNESAHKLIKVLIEKIKSKVNDAQNFDLWWRWILE